MTECNHDEVFEHLIEIGKHNRRITDWHEKVRMERTAPFAIPASNLLDDPRTFGPPNYYVWDITRITASGFTAGSVAVYYASTEEEIFNFTSAGSVWFNPKAEPFVTSQSDRLYFQATGLTGTAFISIGYIQVPYDAIGKYLLS